MRDMLTGGRLYFGLTTADKHTKREFAWPNIYIQHKGAYVCQRVFVLWRSVIKIKSKGQMTGSVSPAGN